MIAIYRYILVDRLRSQEEDESEDREDRQILQPPVRQKLIGHRYYCVLDEEIGLVETDWKEKEKRRREKLLLYLFIARIAQIETLCNYKCRNLFRSEAPP